MWDNTYGVCGYGTHRTYNCLCVMKQTAHVICKARKQHFAHALLHTAQNTSTLSPIPKHTTQTTAAQACTPSDPGMRQARQNSNSSNSAQTPQKNTPCGAAKHIPLLRHAPFKHTMPPASTHHAVGSTRVRMSRHALATNTSNPDLSARAAGMRCCRVALLLGWHKPTITLKQARMSPWRAEPCTAASSTAAAVITKCILPAQQVTATASVCANQNCGQVSLGACAAPKQSA